MIAHMFNMGGWAGWGLFGLFLLLLLGGTMIAARSRGGPRSEARGILDERLARGEISPEEYRERLEALGSSEPSTPGRGGVALGLVALGLAGILVVAVAGPGSGFMHHMMDGGMGGMMGTGETGRSAPEPAAGARDVTIAADEFSFEPGTVTMPAGKTVNIVFENEGMMFHTLTIGEVGFELRAEGGARIEGALRADDPGTYSFICAVPGHAEAGMRGTLTVT